MAEINEPAAATAEKVAADASALSSHTTGPEANGNGHVSVPLSATKVDSVASTIPSPVAKPSLGIEAYHPGGETLSSNSTEKADQKLTHLDRSLHGQAKGNCTCHLFLGVHDGCVRDYLYWLLQFLTYFSQASSREPSFLPLSTRSKSSWEQQKSSQTLPLLHIPSPRLWPRSSGHRCRN